MFGQTKTILLGSQPRQDVPLDFADLERDMPLLSLPGGPHERTFLEVRGDGTMWTPCDEMRVPLSTSAGVPVICRFVLPPREIPLATFRELLDRHEIETTFDLADSIDGGGDNDGSLRADWEQLYRSLGGRPVR